MAARRASSPLDERSLYAEYPFLPGAETLLGGESVSVRALLEEAAYATARSLGRTRIRAAADDPRGTRDLEELARADPEVRFLSFLFARIVLSAAPQPAPLRRWAVAEAKRGYGRMAEAPPDELGEIARRLGHALVLAAEGVAVPLVDYVQLATPIREAEFRLARQEVREGTVRVGRLRAARLLQEAVRRRLAQPVPLTDEVVARVRTQEAELFDELAQRMPLPVARPGGGMSPIRPDRFPPCIRRMQRTLQHGENLSHAGRFCLAAFLHRAGADAETIVDAYRGAPDFDESITRYQVEHITQRDGGRGYEPPECGTLRSHGLCARDGDPDAAAPVDRARDPLCFEEHLRHPLQYYRLRGGTVLDRGEADGEPASAPAGSTGTPGGPGRARSTARR